MTIAIVIATGGVMAMSVRPGRNGEVRPVLLGLTAGGFFAFAAVCYRGAIVDLAAPDFLMAASFTLCVALTLQAALLSLYLFVRERSVLLAMHKRGPRRCLPASWGRSPRSSGSSALRSRARRMCARWASWRCCSHKRRRASYSGSERVHARQWACSSSLQGSRSC
jgi:hypothetical protein